MKHQSVRCQTFPHWSGFRELSVLLDSLCVLCLVEFFCSFYVDFRNTLCCVLLKALGDAADFKTDKTFARVENFLRLCNQNATEMFFGYTLLSAVS